MRSEDEHTVPQVDAGTAAIAAELGHHTALLEHIARGAERPERLEDAQTVALPSGSATAYSFRPAVPATASIEVEAWQGGAAGVPLFVLDGDYDETQAANLIGATATGYTDAVLTVPASGVARVRREQFSGVLTVCTLGSPTALTLVTVKVRACE